MATEQKHRLFLIDDEPIQNEMLKDYLSERFVYDISSFETGEEAFKNMHLKPEVIVLDYHLSAKDHNAKNGVEVLKELREKYPEVKVIMLSGQDKIDVAVDSMKYGAYDYVVKGETAFSRMENIINNASELHKLKSINAIYKRAILFLSIAMAVIILVSILLVSFAH